MSLVLLIMIKEKKRLNSLRFIGLGMLLCLLFFADIIFGSFILPFSDVWGALSGSASVPKHIIDIVWNFRVSKAVVALLAGLALSVGGLQMQTVFRNPLADPYVLGISSGAGLGVALFVLGTSWFDFSGGLEWLQSVGVTAAGWLGAMAVLGLVLAASVRLRDTMSILILGIMVGGAVSALVGILQYFSPATSLKTYMIWTMGSFSSVSPNDLWILILAVLAGLVIAIATIKPMNALLMGETYAQSIGINIRRTRSLIFAGSGLLASVITAFCGPIGFIGIAVPHVARMLFRNANHNILLPATMLLGGVIMLFCDIISQLPGIPINTVTALMGVPVIIIIIFRNQRAY